MINDDHAHAALRSIIDVGTSAGGARAKAVVVWNAKTDEIRSGQVDVPEGFEHWLLKFDGMGKDKELGASQDYGKIEFAYYKMAVKAGKQKRDVSHQEAASDDGSDTEKGWVKYRLPQ
ncbi:MAG: hypothetical protein AABZ06_14265 [Bdellovibrionota bacterium]